MFEGVKMFCQRCRQWVKRKARDYGAVVCIGCGAALHVSHETEALVSPKFTVTNPHTEEAPAPSFKDYLRPQGAASGEYHPEYGYGYTAVPRSESKPDDEPKRGRAPDWWNE